MQTGLGLLLTAAVVSGTVVALCPARSWLVVPIAVAWGRDGRGLRLSVGPKPGTGLIVTWRRPVGSRALKSIGVWVS